MDRVSSAGYQTISGRRTWQNKNLGAGIQGTTFDQIFFAGVQECIIAAYEQLGITPADQTLGNTDLQLLQGMRRIAAGNSNGGSVITAATATLTADNAGLVLVNATSNNIAITMPLSASSNGQMLRFTFVRTDATTNTVTVALAGSDTSFPTGLAPFSIGGGGILALIGDGVSKWVDLGGVTPKRGIQVFLTGGTFIGPPGVFAAKARVWGGGASGAGATTGTASGGGSGAGYAEGVYAITPGQSVTVTVGAGGAGASAGSAGNNGGASSFGAFASATGGYGGVVGLGQNSVGTGTGGALNVAGGAGIGPAGSLGGTGGPSFGSSSAWASAQSGSGGVFPGGGGGGANGAYGTGPGAAGLVVVEW